MAEKIWAKDLAVPGSTSSRQGDEIPQWLMELAEELILDKLPRGG